MSKEVESKKGIHWLPEDELLKLLNENEVQLGILEVNVKRIEEYIQNITDEINELFNGEVLKFSEVIKSSQYQGKKKEIIKKIREEIPKTKKAMSEIKKEIHLTKHISSSSYNEKEIDAFCKVIENKYDVKMGSYGYSEETIELLRKVVKDNEMLKMFEMEDKCSSIHTFLSSENEKLNLKLHNFYEQLSKLENDDFLGFKETKLGNLNEFEKERTKLIYEMSEVKKKIQIIKQAIKFIKKDISIMPNSDKPEPGPRKWGVSKP
jgi:hypothetical protein